jgi:hypothetical protein
MMLSLFAPNETLCFLLFPSLVRVHTSFISSIFFYVPFFFWYHGSFIYVACFCSSLVVWHLGLRWFGESSAFWLDLSFDPPSDDGVLCCLLKMMGFYVVWSVLSAVSSSWLVLLHPRLRLNNIFCIYEYFHQLFFYTNVILFWLLYITLLKLVCCSFLSLFHCMLLQFSPLVVHKHSPLPLIPCIYQGRWIWCIMSRV